MQSTSQISNRTSSDKNNSKNAINQDISNISINPQAKNWNKIESKVYGKFKKEINLKTQNAEFQKAVNKALKVMNTDPKKRRRSFQDDKSNQIKKDQSGSEEASNESEKEQSSNQIEKKLSFDHQNYNQEFFTDSSLSSEEQILEVLSKNLFDKLESSPNKKTLSPQKLQDKISPFEIEIKNNDEKMLNEEEKQKSDLELKNEALSVFQKNKKSVVKPIQNIEIAMRIRSYENMAKELI